MHPQLLKDGQFLLQLTVIQYALPQMDQLVISLKIKCTPRLMIQEIQTPHSTDQHSAILDHYLL